MGDARRVRWLAFRTPEATRRPSYSTLGALLVWGGCLVAALSAGSHGGAQAGGTLDGDLRVRAHGRLEHAVVYLESVPPSPCRPGQTAVLDQRGMKFVPPVLAIARGTTVSFTNHDIVSHNVFSPDGEGYELGTWTRGTVKHRRFTRLGVYRQLCRLHPEMTADIVVLPSPYFAVTGPDGHFQILGVPAGTYRLETWARGYAPVRRPIHMAGAQVQHIALTLDRERR
ncbi:MAG: hypothetical protein GXP55_19770 [Deltaproteobacteria bacterium]|nr:hypothetical protein [Deltaproteobacteria bacterium]